MRASTGLAPEKRSDRWRAWATSPKGERIEGEGEGPVSALNALNALARELEPPPGVDERLGCLRLCRPRAHRDPDRDADNDKHGADHAHK